MPETDEMNRATPRFHSGGTLPKGKPALTVLEPGYVVISERAVERMGLDGFERIGIRVGDTELVGRETDGRS